MKELKFRALHADEVDARIGLVRPNGIQLLLYKDARCDMNILDETVGAFNWKREHTRDNANCIVSIYDDEKKEWITKEDTGTESNTEKEKGLASDSFKRACFNWGIGRELYTAPFIWLTPEKHGITIKRTTDKCTCNDRFKVADMIVKNGKITGLAIEHIKTGEVIFTSGACYHETLHLPPHQTPPQASQQRTHQTPQQVTQEHNETVTPLMLGTVKNEMERTGRSLKTILNYLNINKLEDMTVEGYKKLMNAFKNTSDKKAGEDNGSTGKDS